MSGVCETPCPSASYEPLDSSLLHRLLGHVNAVIAQRTCCRVTLDRVLEPHSERVSTQSMNREEVMPQKAWSDKRERQYDHIKKS
jgi:hypothetical protein